MKDHRLRAPSADGALLAVPPLDQVAAQFNADRPSPGHLGSRLPGPPGGPAASPGASARSSPPPGISSPHTVLTYPNVASARSTSTTPLVVTGHQPELFHPGRLGQELRHVRSGQGPWRPGAEPDRR